MLVVDLSANNAEPDWARLKTAGIVGAWLKATEGTSYTDPNFARWRTRANAAGLRVGAYCFARPDTNSSSLDDPVYEARHFCNVVGKLGRRDLKPCLDFETLAPLSNKQMDQWARAFSQYVRKALGVFPLFYSYPSLIERLALPGPIGNGLWLAAYGRNDGKEHSYSVPRPWKKVVAHQFTSRGHVPGCKGLVDVSRVLMPNAALAHPVTGRV